MIRRSRFRPSSTATSRATICWRLPIPTIFPQTCAALDERGAANDSNVTVTSTLPIMTDNVTFTFGGKSETVQLIVVPDDRTNDLNDYVRLEDESKEPLALRDGDVYLSKSSQLVLGHQAGRYGTRPGFVAQCCQGQSQRHLAQLSRQHALHDAGHL